MANPAPTSPTARGRKAARSETHVEQPSAAPEATEAPEATGASEALASPTEPLDEHASAAPAEAHEVAEDGDARAHEVAGDGDAEASPRETPEALAEAEKRRIRDQLEALRRREVELRRELVIADHPELRASFRALAKAADGVATIEAKAASGLSKSEARRKETIAKVYEGLVARRAEIDARLAEFDVELAALGEVRMAAFQSDRRAALLALGALLVEHGPAIAAVGLDLTALIPGLPAWREEILALGPTLESGETS